MSARVIIVNTPGPVGPRGPGGIYDGTGSLVISGSVGATSGFTGSLQGTASFVTGSIFTGANVARSASYAVSASHLIGFGTPYGVYTATFTANGTTAPVVNVLQDTIGLSSTWTNAGDGLFSFSTTGTGYTSLPFNKTYWNLSLIGDTSTVLRVGYITFNNGPSSATVTVYSADIVGNPDPRVGGDVGFWGSIEIRRYP